jgi:hypothetical protein
LRKIKTKNFAQQKGRKIFQLFVGDFVLIKTPALYLSSAALRWEARVMNSGLDVCRKQRAQMDLKIDGGLRIVGPISNSPDRAR